MKNFKMISGVGWRWGVFQPVFQDLCSTGKNMFSFTKISKETKVMIILSETKDKKDGRFKRQKSESAIFFLILIAAKKTKCDFNFHGSN